MINSIPIKSSIKLPILMYSEILLAAGTATKLWKIEPNNAENVENEYNRYDVESGFLCMLIKSWKANSKQPLWREQKRKRKSDNIASLKCAGEGGTVAFYFD